MDVPKIEMPAGGRAGVLIVDDTPAKLVALAAIVSGMALEIVTATSGEQALRQLLKRDFAVILLDVNMPIMDGFETATLIRSRPRSEYTPIIFVTAEANSEAERLSGYTLGAVDFIYSPIIPEILRAKVRVFVDLFCLQRQLLLHTEELKARQQELANSNQILNGLYRIAEGLNRAVSEREVAEAALELVLELPGVQAGWISLREGESGFRLGAARNLPPALNAPGALEGDCLCRRQLLTGELDSVTNILECERLGKAKGDTHGLRYHASIPLWVGGRTLGVMNLAGPQEGMFKEEELNVLHGVGNQVAVALDRARLHEHLEKRTAALTESELRYRKITDASFDGIAITVEGVITEANPGVAEIFGYPLDEVISRPILDFVADESREAVLQRFSKDDEGRFELIGKHKDGRKIQIETTTRKHNVSGRSGRILAVRDVTETRALEAQLRQAQKMDAIGQLAGGVAHDFNNLLTAILGFSNFVIDTFEPQDRRRADMAEVIKAGQRAAALTRQLLAFSRKQVLQPVAVDLNALVTGMRQMLSRLIGKHVDLVSILAPDLGAVRADPGQLEQVLMNLVVNARDAMPSAGRLAVETANVELDQSFMQDVVIHPGSYVMLAVTDSGTGMDEATKQRLFEPFFTTKEQGKGTGLGLAIVYGIVKQSGGYIRVSSEPGQGATFTVYLPRVDGDDEVEPRIVSDEAAAAGTATVLVVEDEEAVRVLMRTMLEKAGYRVFDAPNPQQAEALFMQNVNLFNLLVTDVMMPGSSGPTLFERLARHRPDLKVLYVSGYTDDTIVHQGQLGTGVEFLQKPFTADALNRKVREVLDR